MKNFCFILFISFVLNIKQAFGAEEGMPQLNPEFWTAQIFWLILIFSSLYLIIWKIFLPKIINGIENRKSRVVTDLNETQKLKENAEKKLVEYKKIIENAKKDAKKIVEDNKKKFDADIEKKKKQFDSDIEKKLSSAEQEIEKLKKSSISNIKKISTEVSSEVIKKIIGAEINANKVSAIVESVSNERMKNQV